MSQEKFNGILSRLQAYLMGEEIFVQDVYVGGNPDYRIPIRIITDKAWQSLFARNMFITIDNLVNNDVFNIFPHSTGMTQ